MLPFSCNQHIINEQQDIDFIAYEEIGVSIS
jgi:hypothetical protein